MDDTWLRKTMENASSMESSERAWVTKSTQTFLRSALKQWTANWWTNAQTSMAPRSTLLAPSRMCFDQRASRGRPVSALSVRAYEEQLVYVVVTYDRSKAPRGHARPSCTCTTFRSAARTTSRLRRTAHGSPGSHSSTRMP